MWHPRQHSQPRSTAIAELRCPTAWQQDNLRLSERLSSALDGALGGRTQDDIARGTGTPQGTPSYSRRVYGRRTPMQQHQPSQAVLLRAPRMGRGAL